MTSVAAPGPVGTISLTGRLGNVSASAGQYARTSGDSSS